MSLPPPGIPTSSSILTWPPPSWTSQGWTSPRTWTGSPSSSCWTRSGQRTGEGARRAPQLRELMGTSHGSRVPYPDHFPAAGEKDVPLRGQTLSEINVCKTRSSRRRGEGQ